MSVRLYEEFKAKHDSIKPVRGHTPECRPIGKRYRTYETIREVIIEGIPGIACRLHNTDCVTYLRDGTIMVYTGGWNTMCTAAFIHKHYPLSCWKQHNKLWVNHSGLCRLRVTPGGRCIGLYMRRPLRRLWWTGRRPRKHVPHSCRSWRGLRRSWPCQRGLSPISSAARCAENLTASGGMVRSRSTTVGS